MTPNSLLTKSPKSQAVSIQNTRIDEQCDSESEDRYVKSPKLLNSPSFQPRITKNVPAPKLGKIKREKFSSTATMFMNHANILSPDVDSTIKSLSIALHYKMKECEKDNPPVFIDIFSETTHHLGDNKRYINTPSIAEIHYFLHLIYHKEELSAESAVMSLAYIERLIMLTKLTLHATNWRRVCLGAIALASKVWEDSAVWNADFLNVFPKLNMADLGNLERQYLIALQFTVTLTSSVYAKYYFELRSISERNETNFPLQPLSKESEQNLELRSQGLEAREKRFIIHRSKSSDGNLTASIYT